jgi:hypothetical protein
MEIPRTEPAFVADEKTMLTGWLDYHRATLMRKCDGLTPEQLVTPSVPPSSLTLLGLVRHLAEVERGWFRLEWAGEDLPYLYCSEDNWDGDLDDVSVDGVDEAFATWQQEVEAARAVVAGAALDDVRPRTRRHVGEPLSLRWVVTHLIEEYARHNGHADLLRERIDGAVGE